MIHLKNKLAQPLVVNVGKGRVRHILPGKVATVSDDEWKSPEIQNLVRRNALERVDKPPEGPDA